MKKLLHHFFIPHTGNNYRAKLLHHKSLLICILFLFISSFFISNLEPQTGRVLGITTDVTTQDLLDQTNVLRQKQGLLPLKLNPKLSKAATLKAKDMFTKDYWAHNSPDGTTPWVFIKKSGYNYVYAGENLARGFTTTSGVINAWMASPSHRENLLSPNYQDIGFAIAQGSLTGEETTLIVEEFGNTTAQTFAQNTGKLDQTPALSEGPGLETPQVYSAIENRPLISLDSLTKNIGVLLLFAFIVALILDMIVIKRKNIARVVGHNIDHLFFFVSILVLLLILGRGVIL